jgi:Holliday junction resolvase
MSRRVSDMQDEGDVAERALTRLFLKLHRLPERAQWGLLTFTLLGASAIIALLPAGSAPLWRFLIVAVLITVVYYVAMGCVASLFLKSPRWRLLELQEDMKDLIRMPGIDFEQFVKELLEERGFSVELRGGRRPDGGIDMLASQRGRTYAVQCKQWRQYVGRPFVQQLYGVVTSTEGLDGGMFVTTGLYSEAARDFERSLKGRQPSVRLIDGKELWAAVEEMREIKRQVAN